MRWIFGECRTDGIVGRWKENWAVKWDSKVFVRYRGDKQMGRGH